MFRHPSDKSVLQENKSNLGLQSEIQMEVFNTPVEQDDGEQSTSGVGKKHSRAHPCNPRCMADVIVPNTRPLRRGVIRGAEKQTISGGHNNHFIARYPLDHLMREAKGVLPKSLSSRRGALRVHLILLLHAANCTHGQNPGKRRQCCYPHCNFFKRLLFHMETCPPEKICTFCSLCTLSKLCLAHWKVCTPEECSLCGVVKQVVQRPELAAVFVKSLWPFCAVCLTHARKRVGSKSQVLGLLEMFEKNLTIN